MGKGGSGAVASLVGPGLSQYCLLDIGNQANVPQNRFVSV